LVTLQKRQGGRVPKGLERSRGGKKKPSISREAPTCKKLPKRTQGQCKNAPQEETWGRFTAEEEDSGQEKPMEKCEN